MEKRARMIEDHPTGEAPEHGGSTITPKVDHAPEHGGSTITPKVDPAPNRKARRKQDRQRIREAPRWVHCTVCRKAFYKLPKGYRFVGADVALCADHAGREDGKSFIDGGKLVRRGGGRSGA